MFAYAALSPSEYKGYCYDWKDNKIISTPSQLISGSMETEPELHDLGCWDMSGKGAALIYKKAQENKSGWTMPKTAEMTSEIGRQCTFHAIWGSFCEDFSLLKWMTDKRQWLKRREMGGFMVEYGTVKSTIKIDLPVLKYYSKLASSNLTERMTDRNEQIASYPVWAGKRVQTYSQDLIKCLSDSQQGEAVPIGKDITSLALEVMKETKKALEEINTTKKMKMGTVEWRSMEGATVAEGHNGTVAIAPDLSGDFFLSRD